VESSPLTKGDTEASSGRQSAPQGSQLVTQISAEMGLLVNLKILAFNWFRIRKQRSANSTIDKKRVKNNIEQIRKGRSVLKQLKKKLKKEGLNASARVTMPQKKVKHYQEKKKLYVYR